MTTPGQPGNRALSHYAGVSLVMSVFGIIYLTRTALAYEGNDLAQVGILIGVLGTVASAILGFMGGVALGRHIAESDKRERDEHL